MKNDSSSKSQCKLAEENDIEFDKVTGDIWIYPNNYPRRDYQYNITQKALFLNTLVALPTGLGKTFIAAVVMFNFYRWFPQGKIIFMAPTRPLVNQQIDACLNIMNIPIADTVEMTGKVNPIKRKIAWETTRVIFLTPQILLNDLQKGICPAKFIKCVVVDEAHKALGNYAYTQVIKELVSKDIKFRVLALTATPGRDMASMESVLENLIIQHIEYRHEECIDVLPYIHTKTVHKIVVPLSETLLTLKKQLLSILDKASIKLRQYNLLYGNSISAGDFENTNKFSLIQARNRFRMSLHSNGRANLKIMRGIIEKDFALCITLLHALELLVFYGLRCFYTFLRNSLNVSPESFDENQQLALTKRSNTSSNRQNSRVKSTNHKTSTNDINCATNSADDTTGSQNKKVKKEKRKSTNVNFATRANILKIPEFKELFMTLSPLYDTDYQNTVIRSDSHPKLPALKKSICQNFNLSEAEIDDCISNKVDKSISQLNVSGMLETSFIKQQQTRITSKIIIFSQYRESVIEISEYLNATMSPLLKVGTFLGQQCVPSVVENVIKQENHVSNDAMSEDCNNNGSHDMTPKISSPNNTTKNSLLINSSVKKMIKRAKSTGVTQKDQLRVMSDFRAGRINTLVSTCVGEEGLDIGSVDVIYLFDAIQSPVRFLQRIGRTGRSNTGQIYVLLTPGREESIYNQSQNNKKNVYKVLKQILQKYKEGEDVCPYEITNVIPTWAKPKPILMHIEKQPEPDSTAENRLSKSDNGKKSISKSSKPGKSRKKNCDYTDTKQQDIISFLDNNNDTEQLPKSTILNDNPIDCEPIRQLNHDSSINPDYVDVKDNHLASKPLPVITPIKQEDLLKITTFKSAANILNVTNNAKAHTKSEGINCQGMDSPIENRKCTPNDFDDLLDLEDSPIFYGKQCPIKSNLNNDFKNVDNSKTEPNKPELNAKSTDTANNVIKTPLKEENLLNTPVKILNHEADAFLNESFEEEFLLSPVFQSRGINAIQTSQYVSRNINKILSQNSQTCNTNLAHDSLLCPKILTTPIKNVKEQKNNATCKSLKEPDPKTGDRSLDLFESYFANNGLNSNVHDSKNTLNNEIDKHKTHETPTIEKPAELSLCKKSIDRNNQKSTINGEELFQSNFDLLFEDENEEYDCLNNIHENNLAGESLNYNPSPKTPNNGNKARNNPNEIVASNFDLFDEQDIEFENLENTQSEQIPLNKIKENESHKLESKVITPLKSSFDLGLLEEDWDCIHNNNKMDHDTSIPIQTKYFKPSKSLCITKINDNNKSYQNSQLKCSKFVPAKFSTPLADGWIQEFLEPNVGKYKPKLSLKEEQISTTEKVKKTPTKPQRKLPNRKRKKIIDFSHKFARQFLCTQAEVSKDDLGNDNDGESIIDDYEDLKDFVASQDRNETNKEDESAMMGIYLESVKDCQKNAPPSRYIMKHQYITDESKQKPNKHGGKPSVKQKKKSDKISFIYSQYPTTQERAESYEIDSFCVDGMDSPSNDRTNNIESNFSLFSDTDSDIINMDSPNQHSNSLSDLSNSGVRQNCPKNKTKTKKYVRLKIDSSPSQKMDITHVT